ncbi:MAG: hypothetical protein KDD89_01485 [Anaerolineales bacterium]|nr:hypothetical protein [Anaerolineales bacterium]
MMIDYLRANKWRLLAIIDIVLAVVAIFAALHLGHFLVPPFLLIFIAIMVYVMWVDVL